MANPKVSVIVPVYNVEDYLEKCVDSIINQPFSDMEIILVDDGSPDNCGKICDNFAEKDSRVKVIHKENGGISDARNVGVEAANGEYICFIDSDDFMEPNLLDKLYGLAQKYHADIAVGGIYNCYINYRSPQCEKIIEFCCGKEEALKKMLEGVEIPGSLCSKLILRKLMGKRKFPVGKTYEDAFYLPELLLDAETIAVTTEPLYTYWHRSNSITTTAFSERSMDAISAYEHTLDVISKRQLNNLTEVALFRLWWSYFVVLDRILSTDNYRSIPQYRQVVKYLKKNWFNILKCGYFQKTRRISAVALKINVRLYRLMSKAKAKRDAINK